MTHVQRSVEIPVPAPEVWAAVSDLGRVAVWNPNIVAASCGPAPFGVGTTRRCELVRGGHIDEVVSEWEPGRRIRFAIGSHGGIRSADMGIGLDGSTDTRITTWADYHVAFGPLGPVIDVLALKRSMARMLDASLDGLKHYVEAGGTSASQERSTR